MKGRVLSVSSSLPRWQGDSTTAFVLDLARCLKDLDWDVEILAPHAPRAARQERLQGVAVRRFRYLWPSAAQTLCYNGGALINLRKNPARWLQVPAFLSSETLALARLAASERYSLLHSHWLVPQGALGAMIARLAGIPHVVTVHGSDVLALRGAWIDPVKRWALTHSDAITANSRATRDAVIRLGAPAERVHLCPMGVDPKRSPDSARVRAIRRSHKTAPGPLLAFAGRMVAEKGVQDLLDSLAMLRKKLPCVRAMLIGDGPERALFEAQARTLGLTDSVVFLGWLDPDELLAHLSAADIFVGPSWFEAQGLVFLEAMLARTPVVATHTGGIGDFVRHEETGLLVDKRQPAQLAEAVLRLHRDPDLARRIAAAGMSLAETEYAWPVCAQRFSALFSRLAGAQTTHRA